MGAGDTKKQTRRKPKLPAPGFKTKPSNRESSESNKSKDQQPADTKTKEPLNEITKNSEEAARTNVINVDAGAINDTSNRRGWWRRPTS